MDEIALQMDNYLKVTNTHPDTVIINDKTLLKIMVNCSKDFHMEIDDEDVITLFGLSIITTSDIKGFKVARLNI